MRSGQHSSNSTDYRYARPPAWFRYGVVAAATLILCSCRAIGPSSFVIPPSPAPSTKTVGITDQALNQASYVVVQDSASPQADVVTALYVSDKDATLAPVAPVVPAVHGVEFDCPSCQEPVTGTCASCGIGPADEYLCDGGDYGLPAAVRRDWQVDGLEQEDTVAHYDTVDGRTIITPSNRVCIYAPRFGVVRRVVDLHEYERIDMVDGIEQQMSLAKIDELEEVATSLNQLEPAINRAERPPSLLDERQKLGELAQEVQLRIFEGTLAPYADLTIVRAGTISNDEKAIVAESEQAAITWSGDQAAQITLDSRRAQAEVGTKQPGVVYHQDKPNNPKLRLVKLASTGAALPGDIVEFTLRFDNIGNRVIGNVTIVDNLTTRLEYVPDSAKASVDADFTATANGNGSAVIRWEIIDPVEAGEGGILQFKCRVR
jgi:uncharacterized repeat protein (TIGR01451 family)